MENLLLREMILFFENWVAVSGAGSAYFTELLEPMRLLTEVQAIKPASVSVVQRWLGLACQRPSAPHCTSLLATLSQEAEYLLWLPLTADYVGEQAAAGFGYTQIIGPPIDQQIVSPFPSNKIAAGFALQAPKIFYPPHCHKAIEFYGVLTGTARWQLGSQPPVWQPPGTFIFHESDVSHAMETADEPLLAIWAWIGDVESSLIRLQWDWL